MKQKASPAMIAVAVIAMLLVVGGLYWKTMGSGSASVQDDERFGKPIQMGVTGSKPITADPPR